jgi:predicted nucleic acid-binding protein
MPERSLRVFLDSNVLISGLFSDKGVPRLVLDILSLELPRLRAVTGAFNIDEMEKTLGRKLPAALPSFRSSLALLGLDIVPVPSPKEMAPLAGMTAPKDIPVLASAIIGKADVLVTGDKRHLLRIKKGALPFPVLSPADFLENFLPRFLKRSYERTDR